MEVTLGADVVATLLAPGAPASLGARIETPVTRAIQSYWRPAVYNPSTGYWTVTLECPVKLGDYFIVWRDGGPEPPAFEQFVDLTVTR